ncbi:MAG: DUF4301 family protein [Flavobacteriaceae bacterium]
MKHTFTQKDKLVLQELGISESNAKEQLRLLQKGANYAQLARPATANDGILVLSEKKSDEYVLFFDEQKSNVSISRFIPASGLASRMFKFLHFFLNRYDNKKETLRSYLNRNKTYKLAVFLSGIEKFPFYTQIKNAITKTQNGTIDNDYRYVFIEKVVNVLGKLPKALIPFHNYGSEQRSAAVEQLIFSTEFLVNNGKMDIHFTIPPGATKDFENHLSKTVSQLQSTVSAQTHLSFSHQNRNTDTLALKEDGTMLRNNDGVLIFRAGGHGSLIGNLNAIESELIFLSNIDNISVSSYHKQTAKYKKMLAGMLISLQNQIHHYARALAQGDAIDLIEVKMFLKEKLNVDVPQSLHGNQLTAFIEEKLNRPLRVCGMVKNEGEPGGGPFWVKKNDEVTLQIVEGAQVNTNDKAQKALFKKGTHFNPVDIVCATYNHKGVKYDLTAFVDYDACFIADKSVGDTEIKALEHPGLWNGAMANWNTVFVEVPVRTFNPVKTVNDLLRPMHQST